MIRDMLFDVGNMLRRGGAGERVLAVVIIATAAMTFAFFATLAFIAADSWFLPDTSAKALVIDKRYTSAWVQTIVHKSGDSTWVQVIHHPERHTVTVKKDLQSASIDIDPATFSSLAIGEIVSISFRTGRFSSGLYLTRLWKELPQ